MGTLAKTLIRMSACVVALPAMCCGGTTVAGSQAPSATADVLWSKPGVRPLGCAQDVAVVSSTEFRLGHDGEVRGLSMNDGHVLWRTRRPLGDRLAMDRLRSAKLNATVSPNESCLFIVSSYELARLDPRTGSLDWITPLQAGYWSVGVVDGMLMVWNMHETMRFDPTDGSRIWRRERTFTSASNSDGVHLWAPGRYRPAQKNRYEIVDPSTGDHIKFYELSGGLGRVGPFRLVREQSELRVLDATSLQPRGSIDLANVKYLVASSGPYALVMVDGALSLLDLGILRVLWSRRLRLSARAFKVNAVVDIRGGYLFISYQDTVYQLELRTGKTVGTHHVPGKARRLVVCEAGVIVAAGPFALGPEAQTAALDVR